MVLSGMLFANVATKVIKHEVKREAKHEVKKKAKDAVKGDLNVDDAVKKEKRKLETKAIKAVL